MVFNVKQAYELANTLINPRSRDFLIQANKVLLTQPHLENISQLRGQYSDQEIADMASEIDSASMEDASETLSNMENLEEQIEMQMPDTTVASSKANSFNLKKAQFSGELPYEQNPMGLNNSPELMGDGLDNRSNVLMFNSPEELRENLEENQNNLTFSRKLLDMIPGGTRDIVKEFIDQFYMSEDIVTKTNIAANIMQHLPGFSDGDKGEVQAIPTRISAMSEMIKKIAEEHVKIKKIKSYNISKTAQHKTIENTILYGPENTRIDPFLRQPVSDWHIVERNKGFGLVVDDVWNIDWETIWRGNIMDKYSRPYKDKKGNWVGGYIQKRFEVDKNIPEVTNMQLKPGERRKPIMPQYGNTESRLQDARSKGNIAGSLNNDKPFNWKEAQSKKKI